MERLAKLLYNYWFVQFDFPISAEQLAAFGRLGLEGKPYCQSGGKMIYNEILKREIPEGWKVKALADVCRNVRDAVNPGDVDPATPYVGLEHVPRRQFLLDSWGYAESVRSLKNHYRKGDILFGKLRPYFHKVARAAMKGVCTSELLVLRPTGREFEYLVGLIVSSNVFVDFTSKQWGGAQMPRADWARMKEFKFPCPSKELLIRFNSIIKPLWELGASHQFQNQRLTQLRDWLLPMLMNGQVTVS